MDMKIMKKEAKANLSAEAYQKYLTAATSLYEEDQDEYLRKAIEAAIFVVLVSCDKDKQESFIEVQV